MSPVIYNDVLAAVSVVAGVPPTQREAMIATLLDQADAACAYRRVHRRAHPTFGDGSLMASALRHEARGDMSFQSRDSLLAWLCVVSALLARCDAPKDRLGAPTRRGHLIG